MEEKKKNPGSFRKGNQLWRNLEKPARGTDYDPDTLWAKFLAYMEFNESIVWPREDFIKSGPEAGKLITIELPNAPLIQSFCLFAGITEQTINNYRKSGSRNFEVAHAVCETIKAIQLGGSMVDVFNSSIVSRLTGLAEKKEIEIKSDLSDDERAEAIKSILQNAGKKND